MEKNLYIRSKVPNTIAFAMGDSERIRQVLSNLIHNAVKFTNEGGITVWVQEKWTEVQVSVQDTGVGVPKEKLKTVFEKFECLSDTKDRVNKPVPGSGLGLNIVLNSIRSQKGNIWVKSEVNKGTTFTFSLPIALGHVKANPKHASVKSLKSNRERSLQGDGYRSPIIIDKSGNNI